MKKLISIIKKIDFRIFAILIAFSLSIFFLLTLSLAKYSQKQNHYKFYITNNNSVVYIDEIKIGGGEVKLDKYDSKALTYDEDEKRLLIKPNKKGLFLSINNSKIDNLSIKFSSDGGKGVIDIERDNKPIDSLVLKNNNKYNEYYVEDICSTTSLIKSSFSNLSVGDIILYIVLMIIALTISYFAIMYIYSFVLDLGKKKFSIKQSIVSMVLLFVINLEYLYVLQQFVSWLCIIPMFVMLLVALIYLKNILDKKLHYAFALVAMFVGVLFILLLPPLHLPDEMKHTTKSYELSYGVKNETVFYEDGKRYAYIPKDLQSFYDKYGSQVQNVNHRIGTRTYLYDLFKTTDYNDYSKEPMRYGLKLNAPLCYIPGAIVGFFARITSMPLLQYYMLSKLLTFIVSFIMGYYSIKVVPKFKKVFFVILLMPLFMQMSSGFSADWLTNSSFVLSAALIMREIYEKGKIKKGRINKIVISLVVLALCKFSYFPISLLLLLVPEKRFNGNTKFRRILKKLFLISVPFIVAGVLFLVSRVIVSNQIVATVEGSSSVHFTIGYMLKHPIRMFMIVFETFKRRFELDFFRGFISGFGWYTSWLTGLVLVLSMFLFIELIICSDKDNAKLSWHEKIVYALVFLMMCGIICAALLMTWSYTTDDIVTGLQTRYFIPPALLLYILAQNNKFSINVKRSRLLYSVFITIINFLALCTIITSFYI